MTWSFAVSGSTDSCLKQLHDNLAQAQRAEIAAAPAEGIEDYFSSIEARVTPLLQNSPDVNHSLSLTGDAHSGYFSMSYNQPAQKA